MGRLLKNAEDELIEKLKSANIEHELLDDGGVQFELDEHLVEIIPENGSFTICFRCEDEDDVSWEISRDNTLENVCEFLKEPGSWWGW